MTRAICPGHLVKTFRRGLGLGDGFVGAGAFAGAAIDALVSVDDESGVSLGDSAGRANFCAGTAGDAKVGIDQSRHDFVVYCCCVVFGAQM